MSKWRKHSRTGFKHIPKLTGVYVIYCGGLIYYIGHSTKVRNRLLSHGIRFYTNRFEWPKTGQITEIKTRIVTKPGDWLRLEYVLIHRLRPSGNSTANPERPRLPPRRPLKGGLYAENVNVNETSTSAANQATNVAFMAIYPRRELSTTQTPDKP